MDSGAFTRRVKLIPPSLTDVGRGGDVCVVPAIPIPLMAHWRQSTNTEAVRDNVLFRADRAVVTFWYHPKWRELNSGWGLISENGDEYDIESVIQLGNGNFQFQITAVLREVSSNV